MNTEPGTRHLHSAEPPSGADLDAFIAEMKTEVLARIKPHPGRKRFSLSLVGTITAVAVLLGVGTATGAAVATSVLNSAQPSSGSATIALTVPDFKATHLMVTFTSLTAGSYTLTVPGLAGAEMAMKHDNGGESASQTAEFPLADSSIPRVLSITATVGGKYTVDAKYVTRTAFDYPTNGQGQTYGSPVTGAPNAPDLIFAVGEDDAGQPVQGYVLRADSQIPDNFTAETWTAWVLKFQANYPKGQPLPLYSSNGTTILGTFRLHY